MPGCSIPHAAICFATPLSDRADLLQERSTCSPKSLLSRRTRGEFSKRIRELSRDVLQVNYTTDKLRRGTAADGCMLRLLAATLLLLHWPCPFRLYERRCLTAPLGCQFPVPSSQFPVQFPVPVPVSSSQFQLPVPSTQFPVVKWPVRSTVAPVKFSVRRLLPARGPDVRHERPDLIVRDAAAPRGMPSGRPW
jgi:hypothetical protein